MASGANTWGADYRKYPWTIGFIPSYILEGVVYGRYIVKSFPTLKLGVLYQDDAYGKDMVAGLKKGLGAKAEADRLARRLRPHRGERRVAGRADQGLEGDGVPDLRLREVRRAGEHRGGEARLEAELVIVNAVASSANLMGLGDLAGGKPVNNGAISIAVLKGSDRPQVGQGRRPRGRAQDPHEVHPECEHERWLLLRRDGVRDLHGERPQTGGANPRRASLMKAARTQSQPKHPLLIPGIAVKRSPTDGFPIEQMTLQRWVTGKGSAPGHWSMFGPLRTARS